MKLNIKELVAFSMLGVIMFISKIIMEFLPNIHMVGMLTVAITMVFRQKALYPIYVYVGLGFLFYGPAPFWVPNLYTWTLLWGAVMLVPKKMNKAVRYILCLFLCTAHGFLYGTLYAPAQALMFGMNWQGMVAWIVAGLPFDILHGIGNFAFGFFIYPVERGLTLAKRYV